MPFGDGQGPWWARGRWNCWRGYGYGRGYGMGRGYGRGFGMGFGRGYGFYGSANYAETPQSTNVPQPSKENEISELKSYANELKAELDDIKKRIKELGGK